MALLLALCGCQSDPADAPGGEDDDGAGASTTGTGTTTGSATTFADASACERSRDCDQGSPHCVAPYDPGVGEIGASVCVAACVDAGDLARACVDDDGCCAGLLCNPVDGFCAAEPADETTSSTSGDTDTDTDTTTTSGGASTSSGGASSSSSTGG